MQLQFIFWPYVIRLKVVQFFAMFLMQNSF